MINHIVKICLLAPVLNASISLKVRKKNTISKKNNKKKSGG